MRVASVSLSALAIVTAAGCANDPLYLPSPMTLEAGVDMMGMRSEGRASLELPIKTETAEDAARRAERAAQLTPVEVPYVRVGDLEISVEWTIRNLDGSDGQALIQLNGANEYFIYDPTLIVLNPEDDEAAPTPGLEGDVPINVAAGGTVSGLFTEDQVREAAIDIDQITRGNLNPFAATLTISKNARSFQPMTPLMPGAEDYDQMPTGPEIPREAFAGMTRVDLVFRATSRMTLDYTVRVRDIRGIMHELGLAAATAAPGELQAFMPAEFAVTAPMAPAPAQ